MGKILGTVLVLLSMVSAALAERFDVLAEPRENFDAAARDIVAHLEKRLNITFATVPLTDFERLGDRGVSNDGLYASSQARPLLISVQYAFCDVSSLFDTGLYPEKKPQCNRTRLRRLIAHETGHHKVALVVREHAPHGWLKTLAEEKYRLSSLSEQLAVNMISEGTAMYLEYALEEVRPEPWSDESLSVTLGRVALTAPNVLQQYYTIGGYSVIKPVLDVSVEKGLACNATNPLEIPMMSEGLDISAALVYRKRMLDCVRQ